MDENKMVIQGIFNKEQIKTLCLALPEGDFEVWISSHDPSGITPTASTTSQLSPQEMQKFKISGYKISGREMQILEMIDKGFTNRRISDELKIGEGTVRNYVSSLLDKVKAKNRTHLINIAVLNGLLLSK